MDDIETIGALAALAQPTRLATFRMLAGREPDGMAAGEIGRELAVTQNTMSAHLAVLTRAGLVRGERRGRSIIYRADLDRFRAMTLHLVQDCCAGHPEVCVPLVADLSPRCSAKAETR
jgi:ArsR family transcriptional regulator, arsenate/arsenite/antimonite-responsive transcriptional repressor